ncbi:MAG TPA: hypothetical protein V6D10_03430 [Trichocoleus sp.]|jgi:predicted phage tail protein
MNTQQHNLSLVKVILKDELGEKFGAEHYFLLHSTKDAIAALSANHPNFKQYILEQHEQGIGYQFITPRQPEGLSEAELDEAVQGELIIAPMISGSGAVGRVVLGTALIAAAIAIPFAAIGGGTSLGLLGASLVLSGVSQWLTPSTPLDNAKKQEQEKQSTSVSLTNPIASRDLPVPLLYGERRIKLTKVLSAGVTTERIDE